MRLLHTMFHIVDEDEALRFFVNGLGLQVDARQEFKAGRFTLILLSTGHPDERVQIELMHHWKKETPYTVGDHFGHLSFAVSDIYDVCRRIKDLGYPIHRPPRDGRMAFVTSPSGITIQLIQAGDPLEPREPWMSMPTTGRW